MSKQEPMAHAATMLSTTLDHALPSRKARRSQNLRVVFEPFDPPRDWEAKAGVPRNRGECIDGPRPCPYLSCRHHLWLQLGQDQAGNWQRGRMGSAELRPATVQTCALDVAEHGATSKDVGRLLGMDETRVRQIAAKAFKKLKRAGVSVDEFIRVMGVKP